LCTESDLIEETVSSS